MMENQDQPSSSLPGIEAEGQLVVVTGMTGAGRSTAAKELEDLGFYVMDNLPPDLLGDAVRVLDNRFGSQQPIAAVIDVRAGKISQKLLEVLGKGVPHRRVTILFLEADNEILVQRQDAARRPHPLQGAGRLMDGIEAEREAMQSLRAEAGLLIDTTKLNPHQLKAKVAEALGSPDATALRITVLSFGFKYGVPIDADLVADMRFLPNPFWHPTLREQTGRSKDVADFVKSQPGAEEFMSGYLTLLDTMRAGYAREGKRFLTLGIGCTGGKHRSVAIAEELAKRLRRTGVDAVAEHRDLGRE
jgi:UPF0042 nucleotide-binding protein